MSQTKCVISVLLLPITTTNLRNAPNRGHVANITDAFWHVNDPEVFFTASQDSTIRIWDINDTKQQRTVIKVKNERGMNKLPITAAVMDPNGKLVFCGTCLL